jgi:hypothetical protein
VGQLVVVFDVF